MHEFTTVSSSSYDPAALAAKLNDKSAEGWSVVSIVSTGGDVTAFLSRESSGVASVAAEAEPVAAAVEPEPEPVVAAAVAASTFEPITPEPAVAEPAGWAVAPEPQPAAAPAATYTPAPAAAAAAAAPAVPAGWYADPAGRFELRYWDGGTWTEHVSRAGQQFTDPPVA